MIPRSLHLTFMVILLVSITNSSNQVQDISYSHLELAQQSDPSENIQLLPEKALFAHWDYPNTWNLTHFLTLSLDTDSALPKISNIDGSIAFIKDKISQYLKLADKAELLARNIKQLPAMKNDLSLNVKQEQFEVLKNHESRLSAINQQIDAKAIELQKIVQQMMAKQENPLFKQAALNFEKKALAKKISLFEELYASAIAGKSRVQSGQHQTKLNNYFQDLENIFQGESGLVEEIDSLLKNHNELAILKARVTSLNAQLKAHELTLAEKEQCARQFEKIKDKQAHDKEVLKLVQTLKQKKLAESGPNKYCEGVVKKLIERVKKLLIGYDYVFECSQQLEEIRMNRDKIQVQLIETRKKLEQLQFSQGYEAFRVKFNNNRQMLLSKAQDIKGIDLDSFYMAPETLQSVITNTRTRITEIEESIQNLPTKTSHNIREIQQKIKQHVEQLKLLKSTYCKANDAYKRDGQIIEDRLIRLEQQEEYNSWVKKVLVEKFEQLEVVKDEMKVVQREIEEHLEIQGRGE